jgi:hypothetical protein
MATGTDFLPVATGAGANVDTQANFSGSGYQTGGMTAGTAQSVQANKCWRQATMWSAAWANFMSNTLGVYIYDDGNLAALITLIGNALTALINAGLAGVNASIATLNGKVTALQAGPTRHVAGRAFNTVYTAAQAMTVGVTGSLMDGVAHNASALASVGGQTVAGNSVTNGPGYASVFFSVKQGETYEVQTNVATDTNPLTMVSWIEWY